MYENYPIVKTKLCIARFVAESFIKDHQVETPEEFKEEFSFRIALRLLCENSPSAEEYRKELGVPIEERIIEVEYEGGYRGAKFINGVRDRDVPGLISYKPIKEGAY